MGTPVSPYVGTCAHVSGSDDASLVQVAVLCFEPVGRLAGRRPPASLRPPPLSARPQVFAGLEEPLLRAGGWSESGHRVPSRAPGCDASLRPPPSRLLFSISPWTKDAPAVQRQREKFGQAVYGRAPMPHPPKELAQGSLSFGFTCPTYLVTCRSAHR